MKKVTCFMIIQILILVVCGMIFCEEDTVAFTNVNMISMQKDGVTTSQTIIIRGDRIIAMGPKEETAIPEDAKIINGTGLFLLPGLIDAHVHLDNKVGARPDFGDAPLFLAHGITTVFNLRGEPEHLNWKKRINEGSLLAPNLYNSDEFVNEPRIKTIQEAEKEVKRQIREGYDIIKFREVIDFENHRILTTKGLEKSAYLHLNQTAKEAGIPLVGHAPYRVGLSGLLQAGQSLAHINELSNLYFLPPLDLKRGLFMQLARWSFLSLVGIILLWFLISTASRVIGRTKDRKNRQPTKGRILTLWILLITSSCYILWILVVPPGLYYGNIWLLSLLSVLSLIDLILVFILTFRSLKLWKNPSTSSLTNRIFILGFILAGLGISAALIHWVPFAWRGSDFMINRVAKKCKEAGIWSQSTLIVQEVFYGEKEGYQRKQISQNPFFLCLQPSMQESWLRFLDYKPPKIHALWKRHTEFNQRLIYTLHKHGVPIIAGTDAMGAPLIIPGLSLQQEMQLLDESGLSPIEILWSATVNPARFLGMEHEFGTIETGKRADLLLLEGNPLDDLNHLMSLKGVMVRGKWLPKEEIDKMVEAIKVKGPSKNILTTFD